MVSETTTKDAQTAGRETPCKLLIADDQRDILEALLLLLWHRIPLSDPRLTVTGDRTAVERLLTLAVTP